MLKYLAILVTGVITSSYYFPIRFIVLPSVNTKLVLAVIGVILFVLQSVMKKKQEIVGNYISLLVLSVVFSLMCFLSTVWNGTVDYAYATYFMSMFVWLFGAYAICQLIKKTHGEISIEILAHYLIAICVSQCILAVVIDNYAPVGRLVDSIFYQDQKMLQKMNRLYGIGAMLDTAGIRFSIVLVLISYLLTKVKGTLLEKYSSLYILSFFIITLIGCVIARTTLVGTLIGMAFLGYKQLFSSIQERPFDNKFIIKGFFAFICLFAVVIYLYNTNDIVYGYFRFGFEGIFSLMEEGEWQVGSNEQLKNMIVFPESLKTWIIGDGYFNNPAAVDPYYTGRLMGGYYMSTDIGYIRFIFYCGVLGLLAFSVFMYQTAKLCATKYPTWKLLFILLLVVHFVCWMKVSTDCFLIFALFMVLDKEENEAYNERIKLLE